MDFPPKEFKDVAPVHEINNSGLSLSYLEELSGGDPGFQKEMLTLFLAQTAEMIQNMELHRQTGDWLPIAAMAHKLKTSFGMIKADSTLLNELENQINQGVPERQITGSIDALTLQMRQLNLKINGILTNLEV